MAIATTTLKTKTRKKARRKRPRNETIYYVLEIKDWDWSFSFGLNPTPQRDGPYRDFRHLEVRGTLIRPSKLVASEVEFAFLPDSRLNEEQRDRNEWKSVGSLQLHRGNLTGLLSVPLDALPLLLQMLIANRLRFITLGGDRLRYGHALVRTYSLDPKIDEDDLPQEET